MSKQIRVLYVHPENNKRQLYCRILARLGHDVAAASDGVECVQTFREFLPDVLILSQLIRWGGSDGVLEVLNNEERLERTQVLLCEHAPPIGDDPVQDADTFVPFESAYDVLS